MYLYAEPYVSYFNSSSWRIMSYFKINPMKQQCCCSTARFAVTGSFSFTALLLETGISKDSMHLHPVPLRLSARTACGGVPFRHPQCFIWELLSSHYRCKCCLRERGATQGGLVLPVRGSLFPGGCACSVQ